jgi:hypothetical protein
MTSKRNITLINNKPPYNLDPKTMCLASPHRTASVTQVLVCETNVRIADLIHPQQEAETNQTADESLWRDLFSNSHTVVIPDAMLTKDSTVFYSAQFIDTGGLTQLQAFYENGGNVIVLCLEGIFGVAKPINELFGTDWHVKFFESCVCKPTERAEELLGPFLPKTPSLTDTPYFMQAPKDEGLYERLLVDKETFMLDFKAQDETFERLGIDPDPSLDCFDPEKSWDNYLRRYTDRYAICLHEGKNGQGSVVWYGDRGQSECMSYVFCKFLNLGANAHGILDERQFADAQVIATHLKRKLIPSFWTVASILAILLAIVAKIMGLTYE